MKGRRDRSRRRGVRRERKGAKFPSRQGKEGLGELAKGGRESKDMMESAESLQDSAKKLVDDQFYSIVLDEILVDLFREKQRPRKIGRPK